MQGKKVKNYNHLTIEKRWQKEWQKNKIYKTKDNSKKPKYYILDMFPYPSGDGLHVGHPKGYIATDIMSRMKRMQGYNVLHPMGFDAFGLPAENYAIKNKINPEIAVKKNVLRFKKQLEIIGLDYDWDREINTTDPSYYKWTQYIFLKMYERGLAYESYEPINWCPSCKTGLANEDLEDGLCERCGSEIEQKPMRQWVLKITDYAERLLKDLDQLDWPESIKESQRNWIGKSEGSEIEFSFCPCAKANIPNLKNIKVFTTRADTLFGATYVVLAPEHELIKEIKPRVTNWSEVEKYIKTIKNKPDIERTAGDKEKTGVEIKGVKAINPATKEEVPIWIADYVLSSYGTGAVMAVPAHDERDFEFAKKYGLEIKNVINGGNINEEAYTEDGILMNSDKFNNLTSEEARKEITKFVGGKNVIKYKLRDWVFSRQRYWGEPIPVLHDGDKVIPLGEKDLPVILPKVKSYEPTGTGESPLAGISKWVNIPYFVKTTQGKKDKNGKILKRETNTMPQWAGSSWYYLRYMDPKNKKSLVDKKKEKYWNQIDFYVGGAEHATRHLIYARFWHKFLYDIGIVSCKEPFKKLQSVGLIMGEDGKKMSKRFGNVINPDDIVSLYGADTLRIYEMFMGPFKDSIAWNTESIIGARRFLEKVWRVSLNLKNFSSPRVAHTKILEKNGLNQTMKNSLNREIVAKLLHKTIKKVGEDIEAMHFNTAISSMMILLTEMESFINKGGVVDKEDFTKFLKILSPFAPHIAEEIYFNLGNKKSIHLSPWPKFDKKFLKEDKVKIAVQINGKVKDEIFIDNDINEEKLKEIILKNEKISVLLSGKDIKKFIYVKGRILSIVV